MTGRTTTPRGDGVTRHNFATGNKISYCNSTNSVVLSVENGCGGHQTRECISFPCGKGEAVSEKLANDHLGSMGPELCERLRDRLGGAAITDSNAKRTVFSKTEADCLSQEVESLVQKEAISEISMPTNEMLSEKGFVSQLFAVPKKDGGIRPVVNLKVLNSYVKQVSFKMEGIHLLKDLLCPGDWMTKVDLKDASFAIPLNCQDRKLLRFQWQGKLYQFNCLPFGLSSAPWIFTKATKPVVTILRTLGMRIIIYIDDILVMAPSKEIAQQHTDCLIFLLENLGFTINRQKSLTDPSQEIEFLGLIADSIQMELQLPGSKIKNIRSDAKTLLQASQPTAREVSRLLGKLTHTTHAMRAAPLFFRHLQSCLHAALQPMQDYTQPCPLTEEAREELSWWVTHPTCWNGKSILRGNPDLIIETDASQTGWGARCGNLQTGGPWSPKEAAMHINCLELLAATLAIIFQNALSPYQRVWPSFLYSTASIL